MRFVFIGLFTLLIVPQSLAALPLTGNVDSVIYVQSVAEIRRWVEAETEALRESYQQIRSIYRLARELPGVKDRVPEAAEDGVFGVNPLGLHSSNAQHSKGGDGRGDGRQTTVVEAVVEIPRPWVDQKRRLVAKWTLFDHRFLPLANPTADLQRAIYRFHGATITATAQRIAFKHTLTGLGLSPGLYYVSAEISTVGELRPGQRHHSVLSLGSFRVGSAPPEIQVVLPHYRSWYKEDRKLLEMRHAEATAIGGEVTIRAKMESHLAQEQIRAIYQEISVSSESRRPRVVLRQQLTATELPPTVDLRFPRQRLKPGTHRLRLSVYIETSAKAPSGAAPLRGYHIANDLNLYVPATLPTNAPPTAKPTPTTKAQLGVRNASTDNARNRRLDEDLALLFQRHAAAYGYRYRLHRLKNAWKTLGQTLAKPAPVTQTAYGPPPKRGWRIDQAVASDAPTLEQAEHKIRCLGRQHCRLWLRLSNGPDSKGREKVRSCKLTVALRSTTDRKVRIAERSFRLTGPITILDIPLRKKTLYRDSYQGSAKIVCAGETQSKTFALHVTSDH